jgi:type IX secretion system PorP/SprF family membrane protein
MTNNKKMKRIQIILSIVLLVPFAGRSQQQPMYAQYMFNGLNINPAYAGHRGVPNATMLMRRQWVDFPGAPTTGSVSFDQRITDHNFSWGGQMYFDHIYIERTSGVQGFFAYHAPFENSTLTLGISSGMLNYNVNYGRAFALDAGDPQTQAVVNALLPTFGFGALWASERFYLGFSSPALLRTKYNVAGQALISRAGAEGHYFLNGGGVFKATPEIVIKPSFLLKAVSGAPVQADLNLNIWLHDRVGGGISYRTEDAVYGLLELQLTDKLRFGYAYEHNISRLVNFNQGSHEIMMRYEWGRSLREKVLSPRYY